MNTLFFTSALLVFAGGPPIYKDREPHPLAPSLPRLTKAEYEKIDTVIERFVQYDIGKLKGVEGKKALEEFNRLGPESIFNLIEGLNRAANMEDSCPAVIIAKRVASILTRTEDLELLAFAKDTIGADVKAKRHMNVLRDLQFNILLRKTALQRRGVTVAKALSPAELEKAVAKQSGAQLTTLLQRQSGEALKGLLKNDRKDVRIAAAQTIGAKKLRYGSELIGLLQDGDGDVRQAARRALVQISGGVDHGPSLDASFDERESAIARWREWWSRQK